MIPPCNPHRMHTSLMFVCFDVSHTHTLGISNSDLCADHCQAECTGQRVVLRPLSGQCFINHKVIRKATRLSQGQSALHHQYISSDWLGRLIPWNNNLFLHFHQIRSVYSYWDHTHTFIYSRLSLIRSPLGPCTLAGIARWPHFGK